MKKTRNPSEQRIERQLRLAKVRHKYEPRRIPYIIAGHYIPDWEVDTPTGQILIEYKGYFRPEAKRKMVAVKKCNPHLDIRIVFYAYKKKDIDWAIRHGFRYAIGTIPKEWLAGL